MDLLAEALRKIESQAAELSECYQHIDMLETELAEKTIELQAAVGQLSLLKVDRRYVA